MNLNYTRTIQVFFGKNTIKYKMICILLCEYAFFLIQTSTYVELDIKQHLKSM